MQEIVTCSACGLVQQCPATPEGSRAICARCHFEVRQRKVGSRVRTVALALGALILYVPANILPIVETDYWGPAQDGTVFRLDDKPQTEWLAWAPSIRLIPQNNAPEQASYNSQR